mmetsp:Transcript_17270/g.45242  ORF Transcript_17270/g.45242 Transcript_17270/m.45242 type:complete len:221 (+) Transcript_17270:1340-2002(+)
MVCRVDVFSTTHLPWRCASRSTAAPSSSSSLSGCTSSTSTILDTKYGSWLFILIFSLFSLIFSRSPLCSRLRRVDSSFNTRFSLSRSRERCEIASADMPYSSEGRSWSCSSSKICLSRSMAGQGEGKGLAQGKLIAGPYAPHRCWSTTSTKHSSFKKKILSYPSTSLPTLGMGTLESKPSSVLLPGNACFWKTYICTISYKTNTHKVATKIAFYILSRSI